MEERAASAPLLPLAQNTSKDRASGAELTHLRTNGGLGFYALYLKGDIDLFAHN